MNRLIFAAALVSSTAIGFQLSSTRADVLFYTLPGKSGLTVTLQGATGVNPGGTVTYTHPKFGKIHFDRESIDIHKVPTVQSQFNKQLNKAGSSADQCMAAAQFALRHGLLMQFHMAVDKALAADPKHVRA